MNIKELEKDPMIKWAKWISKTEIHFQTKFNDDGIAWLFKQWINDEGKTMVSVTKLIK